MKERFQAAGGRKDKSYNIHIVKDPITIDLHDLTWKEVKYLDEVLQLLLYED